MDNRIKSKIINNEEGRKFIVNIVDFFVNESMAETEDCRNRQNKVIKDIEKRRYKDYKFIRDSINISTSPKDIYYVLLRKAVSYIDFIEDGYDHDLQFPVYILSKFELNSWFKRNFETYYTEEMIVALTNKLFNSIYRNIWLWKQFMYITVFII